MEKWLQNKSWNTENNNNTVVSLTFRTKPIKAGHLEQSIKNLIYMNVIIFIIHVCRGENIFYMFFVKSQLLITGMLCTCGIRMNINHVVRKHKSTFMMTLGKGQLISSDTDSDEILTQTDEISHIVDPK